MKNWTTCSGVGTRNSDSNHKPRNQIKRQPDPRPSDALLKLEEPPPAERSLPLDCHRTCFWLWCAVHFQRCKKSSNPAPPARVRVTLVGSGTSPLFAGSSKKLGPP